MKNCKKMIVLMFALVLVFTISAQAGSEGRKGYRTYEFPDLNVAVEIPGSLHAATRSTTSSDPVFGLLDISSEELKMNFSIQNIYLEVFPEDISYEIILSGAPAPAGAKDFDTLSESEIMDTVTEKNKDASYRIESINGTKYLVTHLNAPETADFSTRSAYVLKYATVSRGRSVSFTLQSKKEPSEDVSRIYQDMLRSVQYREIKASFLNNPGLMELASTFLGLCIVIGILGVILLCLQRLDKKPRRPDA